MLKTPVLLIIFNRPDTTKKVIGALRQVKPEKIYIAADGPRINNPQDLKKCQETRALIKQIDWDCQIKTLFQKKNLGCGLGPVTAINWFFKFQPQGIILEDDCIPNRDFFKFCEDLLNFYITNEKIMHISGDNFQDGHQRGDGSYYFSEYTHNWGWATWKRAWNYFDFNLLSEQERKHVWDRQWQMSVKLRNGLSIIPNNNLVTNIGTGIEATHTKNQGYHLNLKTKRLPFPLKHPRLIKINFLADFYTFRNHFNGSPIQKFYTIIPPKIKKIILNSTFYKTIQYEKWKKSLSIQMIAYSHHPFFNEFNKLLAQLGSAQRYQQKTINFLNYQFTIADGPSFLWQFKEIFIDEFYRFPSSENGKMVILDCGANVGLSCLFFAINYPQSVITAFEADPAIAQICLKNIKQNNLKNIKLINKAVWINESGVQFHVDGADGGSIIGNTVQKVAVKSIRLKTLLEEQKHIDMLKMDIEGAETEVLLDCQNSLEKVDNLFIEYHSWANLPQSLNIILAILTKNGFRYFLKTAIDKQIPLMNQKNSLGMDLQVNIFAYKESS